MGNARGFLRSWPGAPKRPSAESSAPGDALDVVPVVNGAVRVEKQDTGLLLWVPLKLRWWMGPPLGWVLPFRREKGIALDSLGREVFEACDGNSTIERIVESFAAHHKLRFHEARQSVLMFLKMLGERKVVAFVAAKQAATIRHDSSGGDQSVLDDPRVGASTS